MNVKACEMAEMNNLKRPYTQISSNLSTTADRAVGVKECLVLAVMPWKWQGKGIKGYQRKCNQRLSVEIT